MAPTEPPDGQFHSERQKSRLNKRKAVSDSLRNTREELFAGEFDRYFFSWRVLVEISSLVSRSLIVASEYDPFSIIEKLYPYLAGSASIVVQSPHAQVVLTGMLHLTEY
jgi:tRNA (adenine-N(1)-)-methyltransferase non-catalytic subunit